jgi:hypothetical protein
MANINIKININREDKLIKEVNEANGQRGQRLV